jgi:hypothetical protein
MGAVSCLLLKRASTSRPSGKWNDEDYDVLADGTVVGRIQRFSGQEKRVLGATLR